MVNQAIIYSFIQILPCAHLENGMESDAQSEILTGSDTSSHIPAYLSLQLNNLDTYQAPPSSLDTISTVPLVPIIRVFGTTTSGLTATVHIHGIFPYFYIEFNEKLERVSDYINAFQEALTASLNVAFRRDPKKPAKFIADISLCKAVPFYGFHVGWKLFLKVSLLNPSYMFKCTDLLRSGAVFGTQFQLYEAHIPYFLQFFADFNLYGCGMLRICDCVFRGDQAKIASRLEPRLSQSRRIKVSDLPPISFSNIELDISAAWIDNRLDLDRFDIHTDLSHEQLIPPDHKYLSSMRGIWQEDKLRRAEYGYGPYIEPEQRQRPPHVMWSKEIELWSNFAETVSHMNCTDDIPEMYPGIVTMFELATKLCVPRKQSLAQTSGSLLVLPEKSSPGHFEPSKPAADADWGKTMRTTPANTCSSFREEQNAFTSNDPDILTTVIDDTDEELAFSYFSDDFDKLSREAADFLSLSQTSSVRYPICSAEEYQLRAWPPSVEQVELTFNDFGLPTVPAPEPFYSNPMDIPSHVETHNASSTVRPLHVPLFDCEVPLGIYNLGYEPSRSTLFLEYSQRPPSFQSVSVWIDETRSTPVPMRSQVLQSQIQVATQRDAFRYETQELHQKLIRRRRKEMSVLVMELHASCQENMVPDPKQDKIQSIFWQFKDDLENMEAGTRSGVILVSEGLMPADKLKNFSASIDCGATFVPTEPELIAHLVRTVRILDPDVLAGYEVHASSWGYLIERSAVLQEEYADHNDAESSTVPLHIQELYGFDILDQLSRIRERNSGKMGDSWGFSHATAYKVAGRHILNVWRTLRASLQLTQYTLENVVYEALHERIPHYSFDITTRLFNGGVHTLTHLLNYYVKRVDYVIKLIYNQELITRYSEEARLIGIDYYSILSRGSQFKVESLLSRLTRSENYILISPTKKQVGSQNALEYIPLVMEPQSGYYAAPVVVLDFQSLYPSLIIAYNYCYSTCLGRSSHFRGKNKLGVLADLKVDNEILRKLRGINVDGEDLLNMAPNGLVFVKESVRKSILAKMLTEILDTRIVVKTAMSSKEVNSRHMNNSQLALKLISNVTYGYTSATFSGRMPCAEIADSIVSTGREILERSINIINSHGQWNAQVIYGDTDSIFVYLPGRSKDQAFDIGEDIAQTITCQYPSPIKLKFEKVYCGSILQTKKRYVGYMYETRDQVEPIFDAKGIETVRRDGTPLLQKVEEKALRVLFDSNDLSLVKDYLQEQWRKILTGRVSIQDLCFAKEVRLGSYKDENRLPPGARIAAQKAERDERAQPHYRERVPYVIIAGSLKDRLIDRCVDPEYLVEHLHVSFDSEYYIRKNLIPPLTRLFNMIGANVESWYDEMAKTRVIHRAGQRHPIDTTAKFTINQYYHTARCLACQVRPSDELIYQQFGKHLCTACWSSPASALYAILLRSCAEEKKFSEMQIICRACSTLDPTEDVLCVSKDCPVYYIRKKSEARLLEHENIVRQFQSVDW